MSRDLTRRVFIGRLVQSTAAFAIASCGLPATPVATRKLLPLVGYLGTNFGSDASNVQRVKDFRAGLGAEGLIEGRDLTVDYRWPEGGGHPWAKAQTAQLMTSGASVIVASGTLWRAVREVTDSVPIVGFVVDGDALIELGWADSWARPGGNITGLASAGRQFSRKMVEALVGCVPALQRLALMSNLQSSPEQESRLRTIAQQFALDLLVLDVRAFPDVEPAFERARQWKAQAITADGLAPVGILAPAVTSLAARYRLPAIYHNKDYMDFGGLMHFGGGNTRDYEQRRGAWYVARILGGTRPGDLPIEGIKTSEIRFSVNRTKLAELGLTLSPQLANLVTDWRD